MAGSKSNYLETAILNHILGKTTFTATSNLWLGLWDSSDGELDDLSDGTSDGEIDTSGTGYARKLIANDTVTWGDALEVPDNTRKNAIEITFPTATGTWGSTSVDQIAILDASSGGNILYWSDLAVPKIITSGDTLRFNIGDISIVEN